MNRMFDDGNSLKKIRFNMKIFEKNRDIFNEKHNRTHRLHNDIFESNIERILKTIMTDVILKSGLNFMKELFDALI